MLVFNPPASEAHTPSTEAQREGVKPSVIPCGENIRATRGMAAEAAYKIHRDRWLKLQASYFIRPAHGPQVCQRHWGAPHHYGSPPQTIDTKRAGHGGPDTHGPARTVPDPGPASPSVLHNTSTSTLSSKRRRAASCESSRVFVCKKRGSGIRARAPPKATKRGLGGARANPATVKHTFEETSIGDAIGLGLHQPQPFAINLKTIK